MASAITDPSAPPALSVHPADPARRRPRPAVLVLPGGATCPVSVWATTQDGPGLPNALAWTRALADAGSSVELHVYPEGGHGVGLADGVRHGDHAAPRIPHTAHRTSDCARWMRMQGLL